MMLDIIVIFCVLMTTIMARACYQVGSKVACLLLLLLALAESILWILVR